MTILNTVGIILNFIGAVILGLQRHITVVSNPIHIRRQAPLEIKVKYSKLNSVGWLFMVVGFGLILYVNILPYLS